MTLLKVEPHGNALAGHVFLHLANAELPEMEYACGKHRIGLAIDDAFCEMLKLANAAARDNGDPPDAEERRMFMLRQNKSTCGPHWDILIQNSRCLSL